ncbi:hypothetical protein [Amycolatopsis sp. NPDC051128]|uniref:hypothetical protein n=1 Tax=Amycolatopsis sp. NPDC051128 TaxID=3155412 RepID=UPI0034271D6E
MTSIHRPLSAWIAHLVPNTNELGLVNDGDHRSDAREMAYFVDGWCRVAVPWGVDSFALGLKRGDDVVVVELDDVGAPITISPEALEAIDHIEQRWPVVDGTAADALLRLADAPLPVRYWLLERLDAEGDPPDEVFAILPWDLLDRAVDAVAAGLDLRGQVGALVEIRHWLTPAVRGLTGPIEQLDHGLRTGDRLIARLGASALLANLRDIPMLRIPERSRTGLSRLVTLLGRVDRSYSHVSRVLAAQLTGQSMIPRIRADLYPNLEAAAGTKHVREHIELLGDDVQQVQLVQTRAGWLRATARVARANTVESPLAERVGTFLPIRVLPHDGAPERRLWIALSVEGDHLVGTVSIALPQGLSEFDADDAPVGVHELASADPEELLDSLHASTAMTAKRWLDIADELSDRHPVRVAANEFEESL